jgi:hypothetical protein
MSFGEIFADAWNGAKDKAKTAAAAIATGAKKVGQAAKWAGGKVVDGAKWAGGKIVDAAKWIAKTTVKVAKMTVKAVGIVFEAKRHIADIKFGIFRAFSEKLIGGHCIPCKVSENIRGLLGKNIKPEEANAALDDAKLAQAVYGDQVPDGYVRVSEDDPRFAGLQFSNSRSGFQAAIYETPEGEAVLAFAGTQDLTDWYRNLQQGVGIVPDQYEQAEFLAQAAKLVYGDKLRITGHSLGGGLATYAGLSTETPTRAFNAAGLGSGTKAAIGEDRLERNSSLIRNYNVIGDALSDINLLQSSSTAGINATQIGEQHWIPSQPGGDLVNRHLMENVLPSLEAASSGA